MVGALDIPGNLYPVIHRHVATMDIVQGVQEKLFFFLNSLQILIRLHAGVQSILFAGNFLDIQ